jgi:hypothetical protein
MYPSKGAFLYCISAIYMRHFPYEALRLCTCPCTFPLAYFFIGLNHLYSVASLGVSRPMASPSLWTIKNIAIMIGFLDIVSFPHYCISSPAFFFFRWLFLELLYTSTAYNYTRLWLSTTPISSHQHYQLRTPWRCLSHIKKKKRPRKSPAYASQIRKHLLLACFAIPGIYEPGGGVSGTTEGVLLLCSSLS